MSISEITREAILSAIDELDVRGPDAFLNEHRFGPARTYVLVHEDREYDSKAIVGVAHGYLPGEQVLTSGGDQVYPRGLPVGTIESIKTDPDHQPYTLIQLQPAANLNQLEEVLIITGTQPTLPLPAQHDLAVGAATAEAQAAAAKQLADQQAAEAAAKSAAQIVADRLPSLHDPDHPDTNQPAPGTPGAPVPGGVVPKPLPTIRPDRYTSGSTPPAADLKPGAAERNNPTTIAPPPTTTNQPPSTDQPATTKPRKPQPQPDAAQPPNPQP